MYPTLRSRIRGHIRGFFYWWFVFSRQDRNDWREADRRWKESQRHTV